MKSRALPQFRMFLRMTGLILAWSIVVGLVLGTDSGVYHVRNFVPSFALFGALLGLIAVVVALPFGEVHNRGRFKLALAVCTSVLPAFMAIFMVIMAEGLGASPSANIFLLAITSIFPCVIWFSQIVARKYLREISPRKRMVKSAYDGPNPAAAESAASG